MLEGLQNLGNTCSVNTLIQCIGHCDHLRAWLLSVNGDGDTNRAGEGGKPLLSRELARITREMWMEKKSLAPWLFLKTLFASLEGMVQRGEQMDLSELWMLLVDRINEEIGTRKEDALIEGGVGDAGGVGGGGAGGGAGAEEFTRAWKVHNERCMSPWLQEVQGWTQTQIACHRCGKSARLYEPFCFLGLDIHESTGDMSQMFKRMFQEEQIGERECDHCKSRAAATKNTNICMYPRVLVCCFKRFAMTPHGTAHKCSDAIQIPLHIRFSHVAGTYSLQSIGNHLGSLQGGHYYAIAKNPDGRWAMYDDISITEVPDITTVIKNNRDAYMLFYELTG